MQEHLSPQEKTPLELFKKEMEKLVKQEREKQGAWEKRGRKGEAFNPDLTEINPDLLTEDDRKIWNEIRQGTLTRNNWNTYSEKTAKEIKTMSPEDRDGRNSFRAFAANRAGPILNKNS